MTNTKDYFFCGVGGSGMLPLAMILKARGANVAGSDRALDQGMTPAKFDYLRERGIALFPQDGSGLTSGEQVLVASAAVENTVPDVAAAMATGAKRMTRAALLAQLFNEAETPIGVAGTSGKSTTTAMIGWILHHAGAAPTIMNGAVMKNFVRDDALFASALVGEGEAFISEVDESDGSIAMFDPKISVLNNIALDHKSMDELRALFGGFVDRAKTAVLNLDNDETRAIAEVRGAKALTYSVDGREADFVATAIEPRPFGVSFAVAAKDGAQAEIELLMPGRHNVSNALAAIAAASACGVSLTSAAAALSEFQGVKRRLEYVGEAGGVAVIDDFAHNPDKLTASLTTLHEFDGRLLIMFQPHGFGPLKKMKDEFIATFADNLSADDILVMPPPAYFGGTVDRSVTHEDIAAGIMKAGRRAEALASREACRERLLSEAKPGDRIIIMGARDDTLSVFAGELVEALGEQSRRAG
ncbi:MAG: Mur ligase family protein [Pseudomonadota bacterium]